ncbi:hypothetical protein ES288_D10G156500v1 [Gossypium darwinii]|uniref:Uncharacterized protein n=2 Tax=Gossypium TaxID=3633 RepID=A0A5D2J670_GOSTO|nr:hypothetical protein ES288_D10G156500v1 [Gossypium darwinii]TYH49769.1 hypothetical protein ES332_D10G158300v1 [Gossypium tomentosum]
MDLSAPTQEANELPCNGSTAFQHPLLLQFTSTCFLIILINVFGGLDYEVDPLILWELKNLRPSFIQLLSTTKSRISIMSRSRCKVTYFT